MKLQQKTTKMKYIIQWTKEKKIWTKRNENAI